MPWPPDYIIMFILNNHHSIAHHFLSELRSAEVQKDSMRFRRNMERLGEIMAYEISKTFAYNTLTVQTPLGQAPSYTLDSQPLLAVVLRAGLPFYQGFLNYFDRSDTAFIASYRGPAGDDGSFDIKMDYLASPTLQGRTLVLIDPMLATGRSVLTAYQSLLKQGKPASTHIASVIATPTGIDFLKKNIPDLTLWVGAVDQELNRKSYIIPGLGDAGDLAFGTKI